MEEADARMVEEGKRKQETWVQEKKRSELLRAKEKVWDREKRRMREEKERALILKRQEEREAKWQEEQEQRQRLRLERPHFVRVCSHFALDFTYILFSSQ